MNSNKPLTAKEAADYLDISKSHLYQLTSKGKIPHYKPNGKRLYIFQSDLDDYIRSGKVKTNKELEVEAEEYLEATK
jgi:excisionase family DNA binding protein